MPMPPNNIPSPSALQQRIVERIQHEELITFADYMRMALYEPGYGYYVSGATRVGWEGDFYTSTDVSNLFAHCMGRQLYQMWQTLGTPAPFTVLEQGAGRERLSGQRLLPLCRSDLPGRYPALGTDRRLPVRHA